MAVTSPIAEHRRGKEAHRRASHHDVAGGRIGVSATVGVRRNAAFLEHGFDLIVRRALRLTRCVAGNRVFSIPYYSLARELDRPTLLRM
jgi:hypothetical protein